MKKIVSLLAMFLLPLFVVGQYKVYIQESPDPAKWDDVYLSGTNSSGEFSGTVFNEDEGITPTNTPAKGFFGKIKLIGAPQDIGALEYLHIYDPPDTTWSMSFQGMSEIG